MDKDFRGTEIEATVTYVGRYYAILRSNDLPFSSKACLHISQYSSQRLTSLEDILAIGQSLRVTALYFREKTREWEVSHYVSQSKALVRSAFPRGFIVDGRLVRVSENGAVFDIGHGLRGKVFSSSFAILDHLSLLGCTFSLRLEVIGEDKAGRGAILKPVLPANREQQSARICHVHERISNRGALRRWAYLFLEDGEIGRCSLANVVRASDRYPVGADVSVRSSRREVRHDYWPPLYDLIIPEEERVSVPPVGTVLSTHIITLADFGAFCLVGDQITGFLHRKTVVDDSIPELRKYLCAGDLVDVRIASIDVRTGRAMLEFVCLRQRYKAGEAGGAGLFDLTAQRAVRRAYSFDRGSTFRDQVIAAFDHRCAICGLRLQVTAEISAAEAAHIVTRGDRGADKAYNGLCLCPLHHWAFDRGLVAIDVNTIVRTSCIVPQSDEGIAATLWELDGRFASIPSASSPLLEALEWHMRNVFRRHSANGKRASPSPEVPDGPGDAGV